MKIGNSREAAPAAEVIVLHHTLYILVKKEDIVASSDAVPKRSGARSKLKFASQCRNEVVQEVTESYDASSERSAQDRKYRSAKIKAMLEIFKIFKIKYI